MQHLFLSLSQTAEPPRDAFDGLRSALASVALKKPGGGKEFTERWSLSHEPGHPKVGSFSHRVNQLPFPYVLCLQRILSSKFKRRSQLFLIYSRDTLFPDSTHSIPAPWLSIQ